MIIPEKGARTEISIGHTYESMKVKEMIRFKIQTHVRTLIIIKDYVKNMGLQGS